MKSSINKWPFTTIDYVHGRLSSMIKAKKGTLSIISRWLINLYKRLSIWNLKQFLVIILISQNFSEKWIITYQPQVFTTFACYNTKNSRYSTILTCHKHSYILYLHAILQYSHVILGTVYNYFDVCSDEAGKIIQYTSHITQGKDDTRSGRN